MTDLEKFIKIFNGLEERFGYHIASYTNNEAKRSGLSKTSHYPHTKEMWQAHLEGKKFKVTIKTEQGSRTIQADSLGICPINKDSQCQWGAIDLDNYKPNLKELFKKLKTINVPMIPFRSKSGGIHLYVFMTQYVPALLMREKLHEIKHIFGVEKPDKIFPIQKYLNLEKGSAGSWINMPYYKAAITERHMILESGEKGTLQQLFDAHEKSKITPEQLKKLKCTIEEGEIGDWFKDGPPCLQTLAKFGIEEQYRNDTLIDMSRYIKMRYPDSWEKKVHEYNTKFFEPIGTGLPYKEVTTVIGSRAKKDYQYRCSQDHIKSVCNKSQCILRKFGVKSLKGVPNTALGPLTYIKSTPLNWFLGFDGDEVRLNSKELTNQQLAREAATEQTKRTPPRMKTTDWDSAIIELQSKATGEDAPEESQPMYKLKLYLTEYCFNMRRSDDRKQLMLGKPFIDEKEGKIYFMFDPFFTFIQDSKKWKPLESLTHEMLKKFKGISHKKIHIAGNVKRNVYIIDIVVFEEDKVEPDTPDFTLSEEELPF